MKRLLDSVRTPTDIKQMNTTQLMLLCQEIRDQLIQTVSNNGGHLASNLGAVELTVAIHKVFDSPQDQIVWDVGHQSYTHKILTGRKDRFDTLRREGGLSGFPKNSESEHDAFLAGHASTSISVACGLARAKRLQGDPHAVVAVIGDGAFTGGMAYEGLNNAGRSEDNLIIILNDNKMSISKNVGGFAKYLAEIRSKPGYFRMKDSVETFLDGVPVVGKPLKKMLSSSKKMAKNYLYHSNMFEDFGFVFLGPVDGHNIKSLCDVLQRAKALKKPTFILAETQKGKGYLFAEQNPSEYHGVSKFNAKIGAEKLKDNTDFSNEFGRELTRLAKKDKRICAVTAAMKYGTGLQHFSAEFKEQNRFFDVGIAECHAATLCGGLAAGGLLPVFAVYSSFLQRSYDQILHDLSIEKQHVVLGVDRAGLVGDDGETHNGLFDISFLTSIPHITIYSPANYAQMRVCLQKALYQHDGVVAVRYPRGSEPDLPEGCWSEGEDYFYREEPSGLLVVSFGRMMHQVLAAAQELKEGGTPISTLQLMKIYPIEPEILTILQGYSHLLFVEEGIRNGGMGEHLASRLLEQGFKGSYEIFAIEDQFVAQSTVESALHRLGLDKEAIVEWAEKQDKKIS